MAEAKLQVLIQGKDEVSKTLTGINGKIQGMSKQLRIAGVGAVAMGGAIVASATMSIKKYAEMGDEVAKLSAKTGFATETLSELRHAAELSGGSIDTIAKATKRMSKTIVDASEGMATYIRAFDRIGLSAQDLMSLSPEEQFWAIADAIAGLEDHALKAATAQDIFGKSGTDLLPMLAQGADGIAAMRKEAHELGLVFSEDAAKRAEKLNDGLTKIDRAFDGLKIAIADNLIPVLMPLIEGIQNVFTRIRAWAEAHPQLFRMITIVTGAIGALLIPLGAFLMILPMLTKGIGVLTMVSSPWLLIIGAIVAALAGLVVAGIAIYKNWDKICQWARTVRNWFVELWHTIVDFGKNALDWLKEKLEALISPFKKIYDWIGNVIRGSGLVELQYELSKTSNAMTDFSGSLQSSLSSFDKVKSKADSLTSSLSSLYKAAKAAVGSEEGHIEAMTTYQQGIHARAAELKAGGMSGMKAALTAQAEARGVASPALSYYQRGGVIDEPTLLFGLASRRAYAIAGESGREYIRPTHGGEKHIHIEVSGRELVEIVLDEAGDLLRLQGLT